MSNYFFYLHENKPLNQRFKLSSDEGYVIVGLTEWNDLISRLMQLLNSEEGNNRDRMQTIRQQTLNDLVEQRTDAVRVSYEQVVSWYHDKSTEELILMLLLARLKAKNNQNTHLKCPRLFISHRQADKNIAIRIAQLANKNKFAFWVDVLDPALTLATTTNVGKSFHPLLIACIIEMALINCTHVMACMTPYTRGSLWLPYEYGRIRKMSGTSRNTAAWLHPNLSSADFPEYLLLGESMRNEQEIEDWLTDEWKLARKNYCKESGGDELPLSEIENLPEESDDDIEKRKQSFENWLARGCPSDCEIPVTPRIRIIKYK